MLDLLLAAGSKGVGLRVRNRDRSIDFVLDALATLRHGLRRLLEKMECVSFVLCTEKSSR